MNKLKLRAVMALNADTGAVLAEHLGISQQTLSSKINENGSEFKQSEIVKIKLRYKLSPAEVDNIFFTTKVS